MFLTTSEQVLLPSRHPFLPWQLPCVSESLLSSQMSGWLGFLSNRSPFVRCWSWIWSTLFCLDSSVAARGTNFGQPPLPSAEMSVKVQLGYARNGFQGREEVGKKNCKGFSFPTGLCDCPITAVLLTSLWLCISTSLSCECSTSDLL